MTGWDRKKFDLQLITQCGSTYTCLSRSFPGDAPACGRCQQILPWRCTSMWQVSADPSLEMHQHVAGVSRSFPGDAPACGRCQQILPWRCTSMWQVSADPSLEMHQHVAGCQHAATGRDSKIDRRLLSQNSSMNNGPVRCTL